MALKKIYSCDREGCNHTQENSTQMWAIELDIRTIDTPRDSLPSYFRTNQRAQMWCRNCVVEVLGMLPRKKETPQERIERQPTLEDAIREIVRSELQPE